MNDSSFEDLSKWTPRKIDEKASEEARKYVSIKTNQIRNVFTHINRIRTKFRKSKVYNEDIERELILLKPKLAYAKGRHKEVGPFQEFMFTIIEGVTKSEKKKDAIENFFALCEAIVAYHKFYGGKDN